MVPIEGIRVLDISKYGPTRYTSMILGDLGADVIAVDMPGNAGQTLDVVADDMGSLCIGHNRGRKSSALNRKMDEGKEILYRLIEKADVPIENNRPGVLRRRYVTSRRCLPIRTSSTAASRPRWTTRSWAGSMC